MTSDDTFEQVRAWLNSCVDTHLKCAITEGLKTLPFRVLDVDTSLGLSTIRLVEGSILEEPYVCLSHCWGTTPNPSKLLKANLNGVKQDGIAIPSLPKTFADAVNFTRRIGFRYLWIDSLCIVQDDVEDWQIQSAQMASIYHNSTLTVAALHGKGHGDGLYSKSQDQALLDMSSYDIPFSIYAIKCQGYECGHYDMERAYPGNLVSRGWVYQERILSPRVVYFGVNEVAWECMTSFACACQPKMAGYKEGSNWMGSSAHVKTSLAEVQPEAELVHASNTWHEMVVKYNHLSLSFPKDKFEALSGLVSEIWKSRPGDTYLAGLWRNTILEDLAWHRSD
ncbi:HET-domain-containing protein, partial [Tothia fuscella]